MEVIQNFINGEFYNAQSGSVLEVREPATGLPYGSVPDSDAIDIVLAIQAANKAFQSWRGVSTAERASFLNKIAEKMEAKANHLVEIESRDVGKPEWLAREVDIPRAIANFRYFASLIQNVGAQSSEIIGKAIQYTRQEPIGVTGLITPWNMPLYTLTYKLAASLAVGNTAVCKPSEWTPMSAYVLANILSEVGLPPGVCNIVFGLGEKAGAALVQHPGVPLISFTGGTETAEKIQAIAGPLMKRVSLELGGKNANIVFKDADLKSAVKGAIRASFLNSGQICLSGSRLLIQKDIYEEFMELFRRGVKSLKVGDPQVADIFMGPLVSEEQRQSVMSAIQQAVSEDGKVTVGGGVPEDLPERLRNGYFFEPTVIEDLTNCSDLWQREIFGPVVTAMSFKYVHEAVKWTNNTTYGLSASIWTEDISRAHKVAAQIQAGTVWVNTWGLRDNSMPFGGYKMSGVGREGGLASLRTYTETKTICIATRK